MALPAHFLEELRARTPMAPLVARRVKLARAGRNWRGLCPFHQEKSPSFHVYDNGFHCFGCGASGDAISWVMQTQGLEFMEAVAALAAEAGLDVPEPTPRAAEQARARADIFAVLAAAQESFARHLAQPEGAAGRAYLASRGLDEAACARHGLGWAPEGRETLIRDLAGLGIELAQLVEAGLARAADGERPAADFFFARVTFPIRDRRGRIIGFGARTLGDNQPKYLNGPETPVFAKRRALYGLDRAREAARKEKNNNIIVVEGYLDVITLAEAGFPGAVAPLGTALTEEHLAELWQLSPMPVLCFDGDAAGARAAARALELALPQLRPDRSLRIARLGGGKGKEDPDSFVRAKGAAAFADLLEQAESAADALFGFMARAAGTGVEARAALHKRLVEAAARIEDRSLGPEFRRALLDRFFADRRTSRPERPPPGRSGAGRLQPAARPVPLPPRPRPDPESARLARADCLTLILCRHPWLLHGVEEALALLDLPGPHARLRDAMLAWADACQNRTEPLDTAELLAHLRQVGLEAELERVLVTSLRYAAPDAMPAEVEAGFWHFFGLMNPGRLEAEWMAATRDMAQHVDPASEQRLVALSIARAKLRRGETGLETDL
ncbi:MAG: DNA primase [Rhodospirillales bacterium]|nr:DNA primase [Rhodospirillales bacterium]